METEIGNRGSKSVIITVKEQRVDDSYIGASSKIFEEWEET